MKKISFGVFRANFSEILKRLEGGKKNGISLRKNEEVNAHLGAITEAKKQRRKIGMLDGKATVKFGSDFTITEEEFLGI